MFRSRPNCTCRTPAVSSLQNHAMSQRDSQTELVLDQSLLNVQQERTDLTGVVLPLHRRST